MEKYMHIFIAFSINGAYLSADIYIYLLYLMIVLALQEQNEVILQGYSESIST